MPMKRLSLLAAVTVLTLGAAAQPSGRIKWNDSWTFSKDGETRVLNLPHDWGVEQPFVQGNPGETGKLAWWGEASYSKVLQVESLDKNLRLEVDGAFSNAKVL